MVKLLPILLRTLPCADLTLFDELVQALGRSAVVPCDRAERMVVDLLWLLGGRLPSPVFGELVAHLRKPADWALEPADNVCE